MAIRRFEGGPVAATELGVDAVFGTSAAPKVVAAPPDKLATRVARKIEAEVMRRGWPVGASLGSEEELRHEYGVSRAVVREAIRLVENHQVARVRRGAKGGLFVCEPDARPAAQAAVIYLGYIGTKVDDFLAVRRALEPLAASLAAERITEDGIAELRALVDNASEVEDGESHATDVHLLMAALSGNPALQLFIEVLVRLTATYGESIRDADRRAFAHAGVDAHSAHVAIAEAVISGNKGDAEAHARRHIDEISAWFAANAADVSSGTVELRVGGSTESTSSVRLAETLAARIHQDIVDQGRPVGSVLGNEPALLAQYQVSRAVLREAIRLLEYHGALRMRTGPQGGLTVTRPDAQASIDTMALYLEYQHVDAGDLRVVREAIELGIIADVVGRCDSIDAAALLSSSARCGEHASEVDDDDLTQLTRADVFHIELAEVAGNPVQALFLRIITELWSRHRATQNRRPFGADRASEVRLTHERILDAILAGDQGLAQHRMRRHLDELTTWY